MKMRSTGNLILNRATFENNFHLMIEMIKTERFQISSHVSLAGLKRLRKLPNNRIDFLTVNESARSIANAAANMGRMKYDRK